MMVRRKIDLPSFGQDYVGDVVSLHEEGGNVGIAKTCNATTNTGNEEREIGMVFRELDKLIDVWTDGFGSTLHGGDAVALTLQSYALSHDGTEMAVGRVGSSTTVHTSKVTTKDKYFTWCKGGDTFGSCAFF